MKSPSPEVSPHPQKEECLRLRVLVRGSVQGVGFRPFVSRLAAELGLTGWVRNTPEGVVLTGGCFQNYRLTEWTVQRLRREGLQPFWHQRIPPNDGGLAPGQIAAVAWGLEEFCG